jgi:glycosyltransferase involved in cell wall biosynthesis
MRVTLCVDALEPQLGGIGRYTWELFKGLPARPEISRLYFFGRTRLLNDPQRLLREDPIERQRGIARAFGKWRTSRVLKSTLVHGPNYILPTSASTGVITVHDLSVFRYPETHPPERVRAFERLFGSSLSRAAHVITDTETVRRELIDAFSVPRSSVTAIPLGVDPKFRPRDDVEVAMTIDRWGLEPGAYGLSVAAFEPRKKIAELIGAWRRLPARIRDRFPLVLAGGSGWRNDELHGEIASAAAEGWLKHLGFVDDAALPHLYAGARLFIYPSIYEGFGLPPVEAMASGTPVLVSNRSCLPEVGGEAARYVDPDDADQFTSALEECLEDEQWQAKMVQRGLDRAHQFTWKNCVSSTVAIYATVRDQIS